MPREWLGLALLVPLTAAGNPTAPPAERAPSARSTDETSRSRDDAEAPPRLRLPPAVAPESYAARLAVVPGTPTFEGRIEICARFPRAARTFWLNGQELTIRSASLRAEGRSLPLEAAPQAEDFIGFRSAEEIPAGAATIHIEYEGRVQATATEGMFHQQEGGDWYLYTQLEPLDARRVFPCFDEPSSKVPWQLTLEVPAELAALSNTPAVSETPTDHGTKVVTFAPTPPLPSYLVAFAVGPFDFVDAGRSRGGVPIRIVVPRGRGRDARWAVEATPPILALLEDYFGMPYPLAKLDIVTVPVPVGFGAMENPGLVTYSHTGVLRRPEEESINFRRRYAGTTAHELAHQWFGNYVTLAWWDDLWLNEAFATWMGRKIVAQWKPEWDGEVGFVTSRSNALGSDGLLNARQIRQPIASENDVHNAFDGITYGKGAAVLTMFERWLGEEPFREGVRAYLGRHAWGTATAADFLAALGASAGRDVSGPFSTFLDQAGAPLVSFSLACEEERAPRLALAQARYLPVGSRADAKRSWQIPICVEYETGGSSGRQCTLLVEPRAEIELTQARRCPAWVLPNDGGVGYYRSRLEGQLLERLLEHGMERLTLPERVGVVGDVQALVAAGQVDIGLALELVARLAGDPDRHIVGAAAAIARSPDEIVPDELRATYARFVRESFGARARELGWIPEADEDEDTRLLRSTLLGLVTDQGEDRELAGQARGLALSWLEDHGAVDPDLVALVLSTAARYGDAELFARFHEAARKAQDRSDRRSLLAALGGFRDPAQVQRALDLVLSGEFDIRECSPLIYGPLQDPGTRPLAYEWVKRNWPALLERMPKESAPRLVSVGSAQCEPSKRADVEAFFKPRIEALPGGPRIYAQALESFELCVANREAQRPAVERFFRAF